MRVRQILHERKSMLTDSGWKTSAIPPRESGIFPKSKPLGKGWKWRACQAHGFSGNYNCLVQCNPDKDNWKGWLVLGTDHGPSIIARLEHHGSHPGLHVHSSCERSGIDCGGPSIGNLSRFPNSSSLHRRKNTWTENGFWEISKSFFRISENKGPLL